MRTKQACLSKNAISHSTTTATLVLLSCLWLTLLPIREAGAQGTVILANSGPGWTTHIWGSSATNPFLSLTGLGYNDIPSGTTPYLGAGMTLIGTCPCGQCQHCYVTTWAQLLGAVGANQPESALAPVGSTTSFRSGSAAGTLIAITDALFGIPKDAPAATFELVAWDNSTGNYPTWTYASMAWYCGLISAGRSLPFTVFGIGGDTNPPPYLNNEQSNTNGLTSFNLWFYLDPPFPPPLVWTLPATEVTANSAILHGQVDPNGYPAGAYFRWGTTNLLYDHTTLGTNVGSCDCNCFFTNYLTGLSPSTTYHFVAVACNCSLCPYGADQSFTTLTPPTVVTINNGRGYWDAASSSISYSASGGSTGTAPNFILLQSADPTAPLSAWTRVATNNSTPGSFPIPAVGTAAPRYYRVKSE